VKGILENKQGTTHVVLAGSIHGTNQQCHRLLLIRTETQYPLAPSYSRA